MASKTLYGAQAEAPLEEDTLEGGSAGPVGLPPQRSSCLAGRSCRIAGVAAVLMVGFALGRVTMRRAPPQFPTAGRRKADADEGPRKPLAGPRMPARSALEAAARDAAAKMKMLEGYYGDRAYAMLSQGIESGLDEKGEGEGAATAKMAEQVARAVLWDQKFVMGFIGSSVMCGHDNCFWDNYPNQLLRLLNSTFRLLGAPLEVRNAGQGGDCGDTFANQVFCLSALVGEDVDLVHYTWSYFEAGKLGPALGRAYHELVARWAATMPHAPPVHFMNTGAWDKVVAQREPKTQDNFRHVATGSAQLVKAYAKFGLNGVGLERGLAFNGKYMGKKWGQVGDGLHNITRYGASEKDPVRRRGLGIVFRNWHPGPLGFQYVADVFGYHYLKAVRDAVQLLQVASENGTELGKRWPRQSFLTARDLPEPLYQLSEVQEGNWTQVLYKLASPPACLTMEVPAFGKPGVFIGNPEDEANPYKQRIVTKPSWPVWHAEANWKHVPKEERGTPRCMPLDRCGGLSAEKALAGYQTFMLPRMRVGFIAVCGYKRGAAHKVLASPAVQFELSGQRLNKSAMSSFPSDKCLALQTKWTAALNDAGGHLFLAVRINESAVGKESFRVDISQVLAF